MLFVNCLIKTQKLWENVVDGRKERKVFPLMLEIRKSQRSTCCGKSELLCCVSDHCGSCCSAFGSQPKGAERPAPFNRQIELYKTPPHQTWWIWSCAAFSSPVPNLDQHSCEDADVPVKARVSSAAHHLPSGWVCVHGAESGWGHLLPWPGGAEQRDRLARSQPQKVCGGFVVSSHCTSHLCIF